MPIFTPNFGKYTDYTTEYPFNSVIFPANAPLNGEDLNEMQEILKERQRLALSAIMSDGYIHDYNAVPDPYSYSIDDTGNERIMNHTFRLNGTAIVNGVAYHIEGEHNESYAESEAKNIDGAFLTMEEVDVTADQADNIPPNGGFSSATLDNYLANNVFATEVSRRKGVKFGIKFVTNHVGNIGDELHSEGTVGLGTWLCDIDLKGLDHGIQLLLFSDRDGDFSLPIWAPHVPRMSKVMFSNNYSDMGGGGFEGGTFAKAGFGGAVGFYARTRGGGAVGDFAESQNGFAGGSGAESTAANSIQLGVGTNPNEKTLQVYDYQLMDADGNIPKGRFGNLPIKDLSGQTVKTGSETAVTANTGATIIGDLRDRTYSDGMIKAGNVASGAYALAIGRTSTAIGAGALSGGTSCKASGENSVSFGASCESTGTQSFSMGTGSVASGMRSFAFGSNCHASATSSFAFGSGLSASGEDAIAMGAHNMALAYQMVIGKFAKGGTAGSTYSSTGDAFIIGNGTNSATSNAFRVTYAGEVYGTGAYSSTGADYAEYFEWTDGNPEGEDRRGRFVTLDGEKIRLANAEDNYILGVISANPCVKGDVYADDWQGKYLTDVFGEKLTQTVHIEAEYGDQIVVDPETGEEKVETVMIHDEYDAVQWILNPNYNSKQEYVSRESRKEWSPVGFMGKLVLVDDGTCEVNGYCKSGEEGVATKSDNGYRVMERLDENHIKVLVR